MSAYNTMHSNLFRSVSFMCTVVAAAMVTTPYFVLHHQNLVTTITVPKTGISI